MPSISPDCLIFGFNPAYAVIARLQLNLLISPSSAMILAARLSPIPTMLTIDVKYGVFCASDTNCFNISSHLSVIEDRRQALEESLIQRLLHLHRNSNALNIHTFHEQYSV